MLAESDRLRRFVDDRESDLTAAIARAEAQGVPTGYVPLEHVREHVLWSLHQREVPAAELDEAWATRIHTTSNHGDSILADFIASLACERHPEHRVAAFDPAAADASFEAVQRRCSDPVEAYLRTKVPDLGARTPDVVHEALVRTFVTYWSEVATRRLQGRARIRTILGTIARHHALRQLREASDSGELGDPDSVPSRPRADEDEHAALQRAIDHCLGLLPPKRQIVAHLHWMDGRRPSEVADALGMTRPAISNHLKRARKPLSDCLKGFGYDVPGEGDA
ncbi:MAG: sigma-70 family RNA polymerase sigma factor [Planctomycetota bacterium]